MRSGSFVPWLLACVPLCGALVSLALWSSPRRLKVSSVIWAVVSLGGIVGFSGRLQTPSDGLLLLYLLPVAATVAVLGLPTHKDYRLSWIMTLVCLGLGIGTLVADGLPGQLFLLALLSSILLLLYRHHTALWPISWWGTGVFVLGTACVGISILTGPPLSSLASLLTSAILLPLVPLHSGYLTALTRLPGSLPSFIALLLPALGLHGLATVLPTVPEALLHTLSYLALAGALYGATKALAQSRVRLLLAYGSLSFFSILWWFAAGARSAVPRATLMVAAVGLATSGLLVAWQVIRTRYGDDVDPQAISGLASGMPQYAVLLSLLALAAMGLPPFGVFAGFMGLLLTSPVPSLLGLFITLIAWLAPSWYIMNMVQGLLFGVRRLDLRYTDLRTSELTSLLILVLVLLALGLTPANLFAFGQTVYFANAVLDLLTWNR